MYVWRRLWKSHLIQNALLQGACSAKCCASESAPENARGQSTDLDPSFVKDLQDGPLFPTPSRRACWGDHLGRSPRDALAGLNRPVLSPCRLVLSPCRQRQSFPPRARGFFLRSAVG